MSETLNAGFDVVFFMGVDWEKSYRRAMFQAMARHLVPHNGKVICVERPVGLAMPMWHPDKFVRWLRPRHRLQKWGVNLFVYTPCNLVHDLIAFRFSPFLLINRQMLAASLSQVLSRLGFSSPYRIIWTYHAFQFPYLGLVQEDLRVREIYDEHAESVGLSTAQRQLIQRLDREMLPQVDVVFATSEKIVEARRAYNPNVFFMPEAVDIALFSKAQDANNLIPSSLREIRHPVIGFVGMIGEYVDLELIQMIAEARPAWSLVLIGPINSKATLKSSSFTRLRQLSNVTFVGWVPEEHVPEYGKVFDVAIIPYRTDLMYMKYVHPLKLYEYTAMGKPVVSTDIPGIHRYQDIIKVAHTPEEFLQCIEQSLVEDGPDKVAARLARVQEDSWDRRVEQELEVIRDLLARKLQNQPMRHTNQQ